MRHGKKGKKLNRDTAERKSLYRNLIQSLMESERIITTEAKAKAVKPIAEKLITKAKKQTLAARKDLGAFFYNEDIAFKLYNDIAQRFKDRPGGYLRILHLGPRDSDGAKMVVLELVEKKDKEEGKKESKKSTKKVIRKGQDKQKDKDAKKQENKEVKEQKSEEVKE